MTTSSLGTLTLDLVAKTGSFERGMTSAERSSARFKKRVTKDAVDATKTIVKFSTASIAAISGLSFAYSNNARDLQKMSQVANTSITDFQSMAAATKSVGIENEKLSDILKDVNDRIGDFVQTGGGPMKDFFEQIAPLVGVTVDNFKNLSGKDALQLYVDSLEKANVSQQDMTFYLEAMASDTTALLPLLRDGGAEMERWGNAARNAGAIMSEETAQSAVKLNQEIQQLKLVGTGLYNQFMSAMIPSLLSTSRAINSFSSDTENLKKTIEIASDVAITFAAIMGGRYVGKVALAVSQTSLATHAVTLFKLATAKGDSGARNLAVGMAIAKTQANILTASVSGLKRILSFLGGPVGLLITAASLMYSFGSSTDDTASRVAGLSGEVDKLTNSLRDMTVAQAKAGRVKLTRLLAEQKAEVQSARSTISTYQNEIAVESQGGQRGNRQADASKVSRLSDNITLKQGEISGIQKSIIETEKALSNFDEKIKSIGTVAKKEISGSYVPPKVVNAHTKTIEAMQKSLVSYGKSSIEIQRDTVLLSADATEQQKQRIIQLHDDILKKEKLSQQERVDLDLKTRAKRATLSNNEYEIWLARSNGKTEAQIQEIKRIQQIELSTRKASKSVASAGNSRKETLVTSKAIKKEQDKINDAISKYKSLVNSLETSEEKSLRTLKERLVVIQSAEKAKGFSSQSLQQTRSRAINAAIDTEKAPSYSLPNQNNPISNAFNEFSKIDEHSSKIEEWRQDQLEKLKLFNDEKLISDQLYAEKSQEIIAKSEEEKRILREASSYAQLNAAQTVFGELSSITKTFAGKQSGVYKAMFAIEKGFAIATAMLNIQKAISNAAALPFPANLAAIPAVAASVGSIVSNISSIAMPKGMAHDGIDKVPETGTWLLEKGERVITSNTSAKLDETLSKINGTGAGNTSINITINKDGSSSSVESDTQQSKKLGKQIEAAVNYVLMKQRRPGGMLA